MSFFRTGSTSLSYSQITGLANNVTANGLFSYVEYQKTIGKSVDEIRSTAAFLNYLSTRGYSSYQLSGTYYAVKTFLSTSTFNPDIFAGCQGDVFLVAGGGSGGSSSHSGGGGAGGAFITSNYTMPTSSFTVTIGAGGTGVTSNTGINGNNSVFDSLTAIGGGGGGRQVSSANASAGNNGGSGGGGAHYSGSTVGVGGFGTSGQGNDGGGGSSGSGSGGGGGGAGGIGQDARSASSGRNQAGGIGITTSISGTSITYAGGGGGGDDSSQPGAGGTGGGTAGVTSGGSLSAAANTGSGTGGTHGGASGNAGSGICIVRFALLIPSVFGA